MDWHRSCVALVVFLLSTALCNGNEGMPDYDTIVIGMGAAGTVAASTLARAGKKVLALEAQDRIGGRVYTVPFGDGIVEVGAEWIHGTEDSRTYQTGIENNITILPQDLDFHMTRSDGSPAGKIVDDLLRKGFDFMEESSEKPEPIGNLVTKKLTDYININNPDLAKDTGFVNQMLKFLRLMIEGYEAAYDWNDLNAASTFINLEGHQHMSWHRNGYKTFFELLLNKYNNGPGLPSLDIKLNKEVIKIEGLHNESKVSVTTKDGTVYKAEKLIITVSLGVLKHSYKTLFSSPLPTEKGTAIEKLQIGIIAKVIFSFPSAWWPSKNYYYGFLWKDEDWENVPAEDKWTTKIAGASTPMGSSNTITLWSAGDIAKQVEVMPDDVVKTKLMGLLRRFMGRNTTIPEPTGMIRTKWFGNEFTRGAYTYDSMKAAEVPTARSDLAAPLTDAAGKPRIFFAGEATHPTRFSTVHGAADTGHREAMRLLDQYPVAKIPTNNKSED